MTRDPRTDPAVGDVLQSSGKTRDGYEISLTLTVTGVTSFDVAYDEHGTNDKWPNECTREQFERWAATATVITKGPE